MRVYTAAMATAFTLRKHMRLVYNKIQTATTLVWQEVLTISYSVFERISHSRHDKGKTCAYEYSSSNVGYLVNETIEVQISEDS